MKQESNKRLYFTNDFSPENVAKLQGEGYTLRKASAYHEADTLEACAEVAGDVPQAYLDLIAHTKANIVTANVQVGITPELQAVIDEAKAECEKVIAENGSLKEQITVLENGLKENSDLMSEISRLKEQQTLSEKNTSELQATIEGLNKTIKSLEAKLKKQTADDAKSTTEAAEQTQE